jgi:hypothetical protein
MRRNGAGPHHLCRGEAAPRPPRHRRGTPRGAPPWALAILLTRFPTAPATPSRPSGPAGQAPPGPSNTSGGTQTRQASASPTMSTRCGEARRCCPRCALSPPYRPGELLTGSKRRSMSRSKASVMKIEHGGGGGGGGGGGSCRDARKWPRSHWCNPRCCSTTPSLEGRQTSRRANRDERRALSPLQSGRSAERLALQSFTGALNRLRGALVPRLCARSEQ